MIDITVDRHPASFYALPAAMKVRWLAKTCTEGMLLEVGCGEGYFLRAAHAYGFRIAGLEPHPERAEYLAQELGIDVECATIERASWPAGSCDVVYHCDLLSHFANPMLALKRMSRLLVPSGVLFFEVGLAGNLSPLWYRWMPEDSIPSHRWLFSLAALRRLLDQAGLKIERMETFSLAPQVLLYQVISRAVQARKRPARVASRPAPRKKERHLESKYNNFMRFSVGSIAPKVGPLTALIIARPINVANR